MSDFGVFDTETTSIKEGLQEFRLGGVYDNKFLSFSDNSEDLIKNFLHSKDKIIYAHNLSYDFRFLFDEYVNKGYNLKFINVNSQIISIKVFRKNKKLYELRDSFVLFRCSLEDIGNKINTINKKLEYDYTKLDKKGYDVDELKTYLTADLKTLYEGLLYLQNFVNKKHLNLTIASLSMAKFREKCKEDFRQSSLYDSLFRKGFYGGLSQVYNVICNEPSYYFDVNWLYPSVMINNLFGVGKIIKINNPYDFNDMFLSECIINVPESEYNPCIPYRLNDLNNKLICPVGKLYGFYYSPEILYALDKGYEINVLNTWAWKDYKYVFKEYLSDIWNIRCKYNKGTPQNYIAKILGNGLFGKFSERLDKTGIIIIDENEKEEFLYKQIYKKKLKVRPIIEKDKIISRNIFEYERDEKKEFTMSYISAFITSLARIRLHELIDSCIDSGDKVFYTDTDSIITTKDLGDSKELGKLKLEDKIIEGYFPIPKLYAYVNNRGDKIVRHKGFYGNDKQQDKGFSDQDCSFEDIKDFVLFNKPIIQSQINTSGLKRIIKKQLLPNECYEIEKETYFRNNIYKREYLFNTMNIETKPLKVYS